MTDAGVCAIALEAPSPLAAGKLSLARHGSTFHAAHLALGAEHARRVELLYGFCRHVDDLVDEQPLDEAHAAIDMLCADLDGDRARDPAVAGLLDLRRQGRIDGAVVDEFVAGVAQDLIQSTYADVDDLLRYCYRVAGTVGLMMVSLLEVEDPAAPPFAIDLGIGMQLTNISRDVLEDARRGRVYLPASLTGGPLSPGDIAEGRASATARARMGVERLLGIADRYYRSADLGMRFLPARARFAVLAASRTYEAIGPRVLASDPVRLPERARVGRLGRASRFAVAALDWLRAPAGEARPHAAELHGALRGKPGANAPARPDRAPDAGRAAPALR